MPEEIELAADANSSTSPLAGAVIDKRFEIISRIGEGGMCTVYKARHLLLERPVALKILRPKLVVDPAAVQRFQREALAISALEHPNIVEIFGCGMIGNIPYIAMEFLDGISLEQMLKRETRLSASDALPIFVQILDALTCAHDKGVIHRDLKPGNVLFDESQKKLKIVDFGIAKILPESGKDLLKLTQTGDVFGTLDYMSPEQCNAEPLDARSDLYSMGCLMYEVLDGKPPFHGTSPYESMMMHRNNAPRQSKYVAGPLGAVVLKALEKDRLKRPQSACELKEAILSQPLDSKAHISSNKKSVWIGGSIILAAVAAISFFCCSHSRVATNPLPVKKTPAASETKDGQEERRLTNVIQRFHANSNSEMLADNIERLAVLKRNRSDFIGAEILLKRSLKIRSALKGEEHSDICSPLEQLADLYRDTQRYAEAEQYLQRVIKIKQAVRGMDNADYYYTVTHLADTYRIDHKLDKAEQLLQQAKATGGNTLKESAGPAVEIEEQLSMVARDKKDLAGQERFLRQALALRKTMYGENTREFANGIDKLAELFYGQGRLDEAEDLFKQSLQVRLNHVGAKPEDVAWSFDGLARIAQLQHKYSEAEKCYKKVVEIREHILGLDAQLVTYGLEGLANVYKAQHRFAEAEQKYKQIIPIREKGNPPDSAEIARAYEGLAAMCKAQHKDAEAEEILRHAAAIKK